MSEPVILGFTVRNKVLKKDLTTPFNSMAVGSGKSYIASFQLDEEWNGYSCIVCFITEQKTYYVPLISSSADIPTDVLQNKKFAVSIVGQKGGIRISTNENQVIQTGGK